MEDVVLHYKPEPGQDLPALIETTEKLLLAPFPRRPPQVFSPWFPSVVDRHLPLRPARPPPRILSAPDRTAAAETRDVTDPKKKADQDQTGPHRSPERQRHVDSESHREFGHGVDEHDPNGTKCQSPDRGVPFVPETPPDLAVQEPGPPVRSKPASPSKRCWTVFSHRLHSKDQTKDQTKAQPRVQASSRRFQQAVSKLRLQSRQRVKWVIDRNNCRDIEQVWRCLSRPPLGLSMPSCCNAHIDRSLAQVWVYCDLLQSEQVGLRLKHGLKLRGTISLWERRLGSFYSL
uniref:Uncharacterized protein n=1 Tax=Neogobius melanostomus TaxID=47308 RepID=A0A8C6SFI8_9GOBI